MTMCGGTKLLGEGGGGGDASLPDQSEGALKRAVDPAASLMTLPPQRKQIRGAPPPPSAASKWLLCPPSPWGSSEGGEMDMVRTMAEKKKDKEEEKC